MASSCSEDTVDSSGNNPLVLAPNSSTQPHVAEDVSVHVVVTDTTAPPQGTSGKAVPALKIEDNSKEVDSPWDRYVWYVHDYNMFIKLTGLFVVMIHLRN